MIQISVNSEFLELGDFSATFELTSPIFNEVGSFSYPFTLPATSKNKSLLNVPGRIHRSGLTQSAECSIFLKGLIWKMATIYVSEANKDFIKCSLAMSEGDFYARAQDILLNTIDMGGQRDVSDYSGAGANDLLSLAYEGFYPDQDFTVFPVNGLKYFYADTEIEENTSFWNPLSNAINYFESRTGFGATKLNVANNTIVVFPYLNYVINRILAHLSQSIDYNFLNQDTDLKQLVLFNNFSLNAYVEEDGENNDYVVRGDKFDLKNHVPGISIMEFFKGIEQTFGVYLFKNDFSDDVSLKAFKNIVASNSPLPLEYPYKLETLTGLAFDGYRVAFNRDGNDDIYTASLAAEDGWNRPSAELDKFNFKGVVSTTVNLPASPEIDDVYFVESSQSFYRYYTYYNYPAGFTTAWRQYYNPYSDFTSGGGDVEISPLASLVGNYTRIKGTVQDDPRKDFNDFGLRFLFFSGMQPGVNQGIPYPAGSAYESLNSLYSMAWHGEKGLYENFWKTPVGFYANTRESEFTMMLPPGAIKQIDFSRQYRFAGANWLLSKIKITVSNNKISAAKITAYKV